MTASLERLVLDFRKGELVARVLYRSSLNGPNPGTKARRREVEDLATMRRHHEKAGQIPPERGLSAWWRRLVGGCP